LYHRLRIKLVNEAKVCGVEFRQSYTRKSRQSLVMQSRYAHARQMKRSRKTVKKLKTYLGRVTRDIERKISGDAELKKTIYIFVRDQPSPAPTETEGQK
jgi:IS5 family transposase